MTPHQRLLATLERRPVDRTPVDIWLVPEVLADLQRHTGATDPLDVYARLGIDKLVWICPGYQSVSTDPNETPERDHWGVETRRVRAGQATYHEVVNPPLAHFETAADLDAYPHWPDPALFNIDAAVAEARTAHARGFGTLGPWVSVFEIYCRMRGLEDALMDVAENSEFMTDALDRIFTIQTALLERFLTADHGLIDLVFFSDDMATQESLLVSPDAWRRHFRDKFTAWCDLVHRHHSKVLYHTDGAVADLIPDLVASGADVLNPIQHVCRGMDPAHLKNRFGDKLVFHGAIDNQHVLPFGRPDDVRAEVLRCLSTLGRGGGYICSSCHNIQAGTPIENILAMIETVHTHGADFLHAQP